MLQEIHEPWPRPMAKAHGLVSNPSMPAIMDEQPLGYDDLNDLAEQRSVGETQLQRIRSIHHKIAQMLAQGCANVEVAAAVSMNPTYISVLRADPAFQELLSHYENAEQEAWADVRKKAALVGMTAVEVLQDRLLENPDRVSTKDLVQVVQSGLDYGGHKPAQRSENLHYVTTSEEIEEIKQGRQENVSVRESPGLDDSGGAILEAEYEEKEAGEEVREQGAEGDQQDLASDTESLDRLLG